MRLKIVIFNHNQNETAERLLELLSPVADTVLLDSGSRIVSERAGVRLENVFWTGCWNEAWTRFPESDAIWGIGGDCSLLLPAERYVSAIRSAMPFGVWSPMAVGRAHRYMHSSEHATGVHEVRFLEGIAFAVSRELWKLVAPLGEMNPIGHGEDLRICHTAREHGMPCLLDGRVMLSHPPSDRYDMELAKQQLYTGLAHHFGENWSERLRWVWGKNPTFEGNLVPPSADANFRAVPGGVPLSVVIPVRVDSPDRRRNLELVLEFLETFVRPAEILIVEQSARATLADLASERIRHVLVASDDAFHKSRLVNLGVALSRSDHVAMWDADVVVRPHAVRDALSKLESEPEATIYPFNGLMLQVRRERVAALETLTERMLEALPAPGSFDECRDTPEVHWLYGEDGHPTKGAVVLFRRDAFLTAGGFNENVISYGLEDLEYYRRMELLGRPVRFMADAGPAYHLEHKRSADSRYNLLTKSNLKLYERLRDLSRPEMEAYVARGLRMFAVAPGDVVELRDTREEFSLRATPRENAHAPRVSVLYLADRAEDVLDAFPRFHASLESVLPFVEIVLAGGVSKKVSAAQHLTGTFYVDCQFVPPEERLEYALERCTGDYVVLAGVDPERDSEVSKSVARLVSPDRVEPVRVLDLAQVLNGWGRGTLEYPCVFEREPANQDAPNEKPPTRLKRIADAFVRAFPFAKTA